MLMHRDNLKSCQPGAGLGHGHPLSSGEFGVAPCSAGSSATGKRKKRNARLLRQIITLDTKEAKDGRKGKDPYSVIKKSSCSYYMIKLGLPTRLQPVVKIVAIKVSTLFTLFFFSFSFKMLLVNFAQTSKHEQHSKARITCE